MFSPYLVQQLLEGSAQQFPDHVAIIQRQETITYQQLDHLSNQLAHTLKSAGVDRGDRVGIYLKKSIDAVVAIFAILKAGATYVPLDPGAPAARIAYILGNCQMKALISTQAQVGKLHLAWTDDIHLTAIVVRDLEVNIDDLAFTQAQIIDWAVVGRSPREPLPNNAIEDDLAYILYTSGSTGVPKGVMISHRASLTFINWAYDCFLPQPEDRISSHAPFHFDLSIFDLFVATKAGATIVLVPPELSVFPVNLAKFIEDQQITIWYSVPSILTQLVLRGNLEKYDWSRLRFVLFAGEVFPTKYLRQLIELIPAPRYFNLYGPTETNVCTYYEVQPHHLSDQEAIPIGQACENTEVLVIDNQGNLVEGDGIGELCVRGPSLMKGYWGLPEKTQQALTLFAQPQGLGSSVLYHTGDLVQRDPQGNYRYIGRRDNQIKSRGYRIELGEIETAIYLHPHVEECAVIAIPDEQIGHEIMAIISPQAATEIKRGEIEAFCSERVPKYMIPGIIEFVDALPKTSTGKIDRTLLRNDYLNRCQKT